MSKRRYIVNFKNMDLKFLLLVIFCFLKFQPNDALPDGFEILYEWKQIEFNYSSDGERAEAIRNGTFKEGKVQPIDVQAYYPRCKRGYYCNEEIFVTLPRIYEDNGIPATLGTITSKTRNGNPVIAPYPNWEWQNDPEKCKWERIVSVYRVYVDEFDRLWVIDNGLLGTTAVCPPQILAFNLKTKSLVSKYEVPFDQYRNKSLYLTPVVETLSYEETFVYIADAQGFSLLVYDFRDNKSWRIFDKTFLPDPSYKTYNINGEKFDTMDGILGLALSPSKLQSNIKLFYHAMSSATENWVYTRDLKNESLFTVPFSTASIFHTYPGTRDTQSAPEAISSKGILFFSLIGDVEIAAWNIRRDYNKDNFCIVGDDKETMQFPSGLKITRDQIGEEILWIFSTAYQKLASNTLNPKEVNFRILKFKIRNLRLGCLFKLLTG